MNQSVVHHRFFSALTIAGLLLAPQLSLANAPFGERDMNLQITDDNTYRLPGLYATDLTFTKTDDVVTGTFTAWNNEEAHFGGLQYTIQIHGKDLSMIAATPIREPFALASQEKKVVPFTMELPAIPAGEYVLRIQLVTSNGRALGWNDKPLAISTDVASFIQTTPVTLNLPEYEGQVFDPMSGPNVSGNTSFSLEAVLKNLKTAVTATPVVDVYNFDMATGEGETLRGKQLTMKAGETQTIRFALTSAQKPGVYSGVLRLVNAKGETISGLAEFRWIVRGENADTLPIAITHLATTKNDETTMKLDFVGAADAETFIRNATLNVQLHDEKGLLAETSTSGVNMTDAIALSNVHLTLPRDAEGMQTLRVSIANSSGAVLSDQSIALNLPTHPQSSVFADFPSSPMVYLLSALVIACAAFAIGKYSKNSMRTLSLLAVAFVATFAVMGSTKVLAVGNGNGIEVLTPTPQTFHGGLQNVIAVTLFVNAPIHNAPAGTYNKNSVPLQYRLQMAVCQNRLLGVRVVGRYDANGGKHTTLEGTNANWQQVHSKDYAAQACPAGTPQVADGAFQCHINQEFNGSVDLSGLSASACSTTLQLVAKGGVQGYGLVPLPTNDSLLRTDPSIANGWAHGLNLWLDFCGGVDLVMKKEASSTTVLPGGTIIYTLTATNNGQNTAHNVQISDAVRHIQRNPAQSINEKLIFNAGSSTAGCSIAYTDQVSSVDGLKYDGYLCNVGDIPAGQSKSVILAFTAPNVQNSCTPGTVSDTATTTASEETLTAPTGANNTATLVTSLICGSSSSSSSSSSNLDLSITKTANPSTVNVGSTTTFTITVLNNSNQAAQNVVVNDQLPSGLNYQSHATAFGTFSNNQWTIGTLNAGQSATLQIAAMMNISGTVTNTAVVTTTSPESNYGNNTASATVNSNSGCSNNCGNNYTITKTDGRSEVEPGDELTYTITVRNNDFSNNNNNSVTVRDTLPDGLTAIDASDGGRISGRNVTWSNVYIAPGQSRTFRLEVEVDDDADGNLTNRAEVNGIIAYDTDYVNGDDDDDDDADLDLTKTASTTEVFPGGMIEYTVTIRNTSDTTVRNIRVTDTLPSNISVIDDGDADSHSNSKLEWKVSSLGEDDTETFRYRISLGSYYQPGSTVRNDVRVRADGGIDENASTTVIVIGNLPQTGFLDFGSNGSQFLTPMSGSTSSTATTTSSILFWLSAAGTVTGAGAGIFRKRFMGI